MKVRYLREADQDLADIWSFIVAGNDQRAALKLTDHITYLADGLTHFPHRHEAIPLLPEDKRIIRRLPVGRRYLIIYRVDDAREEVVILGVFATRRDPGGLEYILGRG